MHSRKHHDVLNFLSKGGVTIFAFSAFTFMVCNRIDVYPIVHSADAKEVKSSQPIGQTIQTSAIGGKNDAVYVTGFGHKKGV